MARSIAYMLEDGKFYLPMEVILEAGFDYDCTDEYEVRTNPVVVDYCRQNLGTYGVITVPDGWYWHLESHYDSTEIVMVSRSPIYMISQSGQVVCCSSQVPWQTEQPITVETEYIDV